MSSRKKSDKSQTGEAREWPCIKFSRTNVESPAEIAEFILWLCGVAGFDDWKAESDDPQTLLETLWSWQGAPRKRIAKLCWQLLARNSRLDYFEQRFTFDRYWLEKEVANCARILPPIQKKLKWVLGGFQERRKNDNFIGQGNWGEEWLLPPRQAAYVRKQLKRCAPDLIEESSNYEDALHYYRLPYFEVSSLKGNRIYRGTHSERGGGRVWIENISGQNHPLPFAEFPFTHPSGYGFGWGYFGTGPCDLAVSILADSAGGDLELAQNLKLSFVEDIISKISWNGDFKLSHKKVRVWLQSKNVGQDEIARAENRVRALKGVHERHFLEQKERLQRIREEGGLRMQRFDIVPVDFESSLYVDLMRMFEHAGWVLHCNRCGQPVACDRSPRGNRQRARWIGGKPVYHETCFREHRLTKKRQYWETRSKDQDFQTSERLRARKRRKQLDTEPMKDQDRGHKQFSKQ